MADTRTAVPRFPRLSRQARIAYSAVSAGTEAFDRAGVRTEFVQNISGGGIRFDVASRIPPKQLLAIRIELPNLADAIVALGRVVGCRARDDDPNLPEVSVEFVWTAWERMQANRALHRLVIDAVDG